MSETTPLLARALAPAPAPASASAPAPAARPGPQDPHDRTRTHDIDVYDRFTPPQKRLITTVISSAGLIGPFASGCFIPCVPDVAKDLNTTGTTINYTVGVYIFMIALGNLLWAPYAGFYGRQPIYLASLPLVCVGSLGAALARDVAQLVIGRTIQAFGASCVMSVGAATISDIYRLEERGTAMGVFFGTVLFGPTLAPIMGGFMATYASWRAMQMFIFAMGLAAFIAIALFLPETSHPGTRGIDILHAREGIPGVMGGPAKKRRRTVVWLNPFASLAILRGPVILLVSLAAAFALTSLFVLIIPLSYTLGPRYGMTSPALIGACLIPSGIGNMVGAALGGRLADRAVIQGRLRREGKWVPEDRLRVTLYGASMILPFSLVVFGLTTRFVPGTAGLVINLVCLFLNGVGVDCVLAPSATYFVDVLRTQSAEVMAVYSAFRNVFCAIACAGVLPLINEVGVATTNGVAAVSTWLAFGLLWVTIRYGEPLRMWLDIGYTSSQQS